MRITAIKADNGWNIYPESGVFRGKLVGKADGLSLKTVDIYDDEISGEVLAVWGLEIYDPLVHSDTATIKGLRIGHLFDMRRLHPATLHEGQYVLAETGAEILKAESLWTLGNEVQSYGEILRSRRSARRPDSERRAEW